MAGAGKTCTPLAGWMPPTGAGVGVTTGAGVGESTGAGVALGLVPGAGVGQVVGDVVGAGLGDGSRQGCCLSQFWYRGDTVVRQPARFCVAKFDPEADGRPVVAQPSKQSASMELMLM